MIQKKQKIKKPGLSRFANSIKIKHRVSKKICFSPPWAMPTKITQRRMQGTLRIFLDIAHYSQSDLFYMVFVSWLRQVPAGTGPHFFQACAQLKTSYEALQEASLLY
ncbi:MAG: hypothetical protein JW801_16160 [Bacteroidales bacterium]|nr:hypothetical protein [Bacteroidales bacterium]